MGACTAHSHSCGAGTGIFLRYGVQCTSRTLFTHDTLYTPYTFTFPRVRECKIVMFSGRTKGCFESPPYLDQYGETDEGLRRGNPLSLCQDRCAPPMCCQEYLC